MTPDLLARARAGDGDAFGLPTEPHRRELHLHCCRLLGCVQDAEDVLQDALLSAWRALGQFEERSEGLRVLTLDGARLCGMTRFDSERAAAVRTPAVAPRFSTWRVSLT